jgi:ATP-binding cassette subfamily C protein
MTENRFQRLIDLAIEFGEPLASAANRPIHLDDTGIAWFVERGTLDVFLMEYEYDAPSSNSKHLLRADRGRLVFGVGRGETLVAVAKGSADCQLRRVSLEHIVRFAISGQLAGQVDEWVTNIAATVAHQIEPRPQPTLLLNPKHPPESQKVAKGDVLSARAGGVVWILAGEADTAYLGTEERAKGGTGAVPLTPESWLSMQSSAEVTCITSRELYDRGTLLAALREFHHMALGAEQMNRLLLVADEANEQTASTIYRQLDEEIARQSLFSVLGSPRGVTAMNGSYLQAVLQLIGKNEGIDFQPPPRRRVVVGEEPSLEENLNASGVRSRRVRLSASARWWIGDSGAMLGFRKDDGQPVALIPRAIGRYRVVDPVSGQSKRLNAQNADQIQPDAWQFYRPFPGDRPVTSMDIVRLACQGMASDLGQFAAAGFLASLLILAPAVAVGLLAGWVLPTGIGSMLNQIIVALVALAFIGTLLQILQGTAMMRLEGRATARLSAALWDRMLGLPPSFFREFTAGDLAMRMSTFQVIRDRVSGVVANAATSFVFLFPTLALLFLYDTALAWLSLGIGIFTLAVKFLFGLLQVGPQRRFLTASRRLAGELFQYINGMNKLRSAGAEASAFAAWARGYREQQLAQLHISRLNEHLLAFGAALPAFTGAAVFAVVIWNGTDQISLGSFLAVYLVSMTFYLAVLRLGQSFEAIAAILPAYEQVRPVLNALPDRTRAPATSVNINGDIRFDNLSFRYMKDGPPIIDDVSIQAQPGEFIAIVGESGSGKSTLLRLALGLEDPAAGGVYYDGRDLAHLDRRSVRRQIGVVTQDGTLKPGNLLENIIGLGGGLTIDDAWRAAKLAAVDKEIAEMPMQMFTAVGDSQFTFSGGQIQRIRIAAALVHNPRIVFLDEATSWLDAKSQAQVMEGIQSLAATRIVIAHRLSTIRKAERIYVLHQGRVVQEGSFITLYQTEGIFRDLVQRQMN